MRSRDDENLRETAHLCRDNKITPSVACSHCPKLRFKVVIRDSRRFTTGSDQVVRISWSGRLAAILRLEFVDSILLVGYRSKAVLTVVHNKDAFSSVALSTCGYVSRPKPQ